jgi:HTH-type transcriptional regulator / antitoxin HigA
MVKVIKTHADYRDALAHIASLLDRNPAAGTHEAEELEALAVLVKDYEAKNFDIGLPDPIEAIKFRMDQQNLSQRDLVPFLGSRSKVSEVLSRRRPLTLSMMRALHSGLGIPAKVLLQEGGLTEPDEGDVQWDKFPLREMVKRGWIHESIKDYRSEAEGALRRFFGQLGRSQPVFALYRQSRHVRSARQPDLYALTAWTARVMVLASGKTSGAYKQRLIDAQFMSEVARLSVLDEGPRLAGEFLEKHGIRLVVEPHLPGTLLDGAALRAVDGGPVVALTLRYDRIDNFWFTLMHELVHVSRHLEQEQVPFYDDLDVAAGDDPKEKEADSIAGEALIPDSAWRRSPVSDWPSPEAVRELAAQMHIHPAIVAGRYRHEHRSYRVLNQFVGHGTVRRLFTGVKLN